ncbi:MAG TPA: MBL fold metallo-hydrolase [Candidatus Sulfotelmatobacter sp.]|nr:MBL fold metallo-hydrolase [Candidatus Sulfotelmatobacter sp.]
MSLRHLGDASITRVEDIAGPSFKPGDIYRDFDPAIIEECRDWLVPGHFFEKLGRLNMSVHSWVVRTGRHTVVIDTCIGNHKSRPDAPFWNNREGPFLDNLRAAGVAPESVDYVMCTHLHVDHVGWNTRLENGRWVPTFPKAKYLFSRKEYAYYEQENRKAPVNDGSFTDSVLPIMEAGRAVMIDDGHELDDCMLVKLAPGHTPGHITVRLASKGEEALFTGDIMHHPLQVYRPQWNSAFCVDQAGSRASRRQVLEHCAEHRSLMLPAHFAAPHGGRVSRRGERFAIAFE